MTKELHVSNLSWNTTEDALRSVFESYGSVTRVDLPRDPDTGRSRGHAIVEMGSEAEAQRAASLPEQELDGRRIKIEMADARGE